jgi:D-alanine--D-alanine ligase
MPASRMRVAVLMGGPSSEHDVSLKSGHGVADALARRQWEVASIVIPHGSVEDSIRFTRQALEQASPDAVFIALHGAFGEDGTAQALCESLRMPYTGSSAAVSRVGMDKVESRRRFEAAGLKVPRWWTVDPARAEAERRAWRWPVVVKPTGQGSSVGISIAREAGELPAALRLAARYGAPVLIEEFIEGREVTAGIVGDEALPVIEIRSQQPFFDYSAKYTPGLTEYLVPAPLDPPVARLVQDAALKAHQALGCRHLSRSDFILTPDQSPVLLEINTIPGFTPTSLVPKAAAHAGMSYDELCEQLVLMALSTGASRFQLDAGEAEHGSPQAARS